MKKLFLLTLTCVLTASLWAADVSVTERFTTVTKAGVGNYSWTGDVVNWNITQVRRNADVIKISDTENMTANWLPIHNSGHGTMQTVGLEGGIKSVSFPFARFGGENTAGRSLKLTVTAGATSNSTSSYAKNALTKADAGYVTYSHEFNCKSNVQLTIENTSTVTEDLTATGICRILVGDVTITPYLLYRNKDVTIGTKQRNFLNKDLINNTGTAAIEYSSSEESVATVGEYGLINPVGAGTTVITAKWGDVTTSYTLHVVDGILAENFSNIGSVKQIQSETYWQGDLMGWQVLNTRRYNDDTLGLSPRIQAVALRKGTGDTYLYTPSTFEGGIKHIAFDWRQWASATSPLTINAYYSASTSDWGEPVVSQSVDAVKASEPHEFDFDIDNGGKGNAYLKLAYTSGAGHAVMGAVKITPWLLYITREMTLDTKNGLSITNSDMIDNTTTEADVVYSINPVNEGATINSSTGEVTADNNSINGFYTVTASWRNASTSYSLTITSQIDPQASYPDAKVYHNINDTWQNVALNYNTNYDGEIEYTSSNPKTAVIATNGVVTIMGVGQTTIKATLPETTNYKGAVVSYTLYVTDNSEGVQVERFSQISNYKVSDIENNPLWDGDKYQWHVYNSVRRNNDVFAHDANLQGTWMGTPGDNTLFGKLETEEQIEGGVKHLTFYWAQPANTSEAGYKLKSVVYVQSTENDPVHFEEIVGTKDEAISATYSLFGISNVMRSNSKLIIQNESYKTSDNSRPASNRGRILLDEIHITPWLLYTEKAPAEVLVGNNTYKNTALINNTIGEEGTLSYISSNTDVAEVDEYGTINAKAPGTVTITAKYEWSATEFVTTTYSLAVVPATNYETFANISKMCVVAPASSCSTTPVTDELDNNVNWTYWLGGGNTAVFGREALYLRARTKAEKDEDVDYGYLESAPISGGLSSLAFVWNQGGTEAGVTYNVEVQVNGDVVGTITNEGQAEAYAEPIPFQVSGLDYKGNVVIKIVNKTDYNGTKSRGRLVIDYLYWEGNAGAIVLDEKVDNSAVLAVNSGSVQDVTIIRSPLQGGKWNTLCLPFDLNKTEIGASANVQELNTTVLEGEVLTVGFKALEGDVLKAGTPYLINPESTVDLSKTYNNRQITSVASPVVREVMTLQGVFSPYAMTAGDTNTFFVGEPKNGNNLFNPSVNGDMKGFRAYFKLTMPNNAPAPKRARFVVDQEEVATEIMNVQSDNVPCTKVMENGVLYLMYKGTKYNVQGARVQ